MSIELLINEYKEVVLKESSASLDSCELLYKIQSEMLAQVDGNAHNKFYQKAIAKFRKETGLSKAQFNKDIAVGKYLSIDSPESRLNSDRSLTKKELYQKYCAPPKPKLVKDTGPKINYKDEYDKLTKECQTLKEQLDEMTKKFESSRQRFLKLKEENGELEQHSADLKSELFVIKEKYQALLEGN